MAKRKTSPGKKKPRARKAAPAKSRLRRAALFVGKWSAVAAVWGVIALGGVLAWYAYDLPDVSEALAATRQPMVTLLAADGSTLGTVGDVYGSAVTLRELPPAVPQAVIATEDRRFYDHFGLDVIGLARATYVNLRAGRIVQGGSTITQQVAKNFLLSSEVSWDRKIKEAILAFRIERAFTKDRILELYLNEIYLGFGSYGVAAAALNYFNKSLDQLTVQETAFLAALPKAPNNYHPIRHPSAAKSRRDWVIGRMLEDGAITADEAAQAIAAPLIVEPGRDAEFVKADYFSEEVRRELAERYGETELYKGGLSVRTTLDPKLQDIADRTLRDGLRAYDRRHGWRGPLSRIAVDGDWQAQLVAIEPPPGLDEWRLAAVLALSKDTAKIGFADGNSGTIPLAEARWARPWVEEQRVGKSVRQMSDVLAAGDVVPVEEVADDGSGEPYPAGTFALRQIPAIEGALVALDPHTGRVLAMSGGYSFARSQFNRATQALRQPGSAFKPFVYLPALDSGLTPSTLILDAPFVIDQGPGLPKWRPANYTKKFYGPSTMRLGIEKSRNLMTVRLAQTIGMEKVKDYAERFGVVDDLPTNLSNSIGSAETTLLRLTNAYAMLVNGGRRITPTLIDRIQDRNGETVYRHDTRVCSGCRASFWTNQPVPKLPDNREIVTEPSTAYQMVSMLQGVVERGTGIRIKAVGKPLAGKTGTSNDSNDAWFIGFSPDLAVGVFVGFDEPKTLGRQEQGASAAGPVFRDFMGDALKDQPAIPFRIPPGIRLVRVNAVTGHLAQPGEGNVILEAFKPGTLPTESSDVVEGISAADSGPTTGTGGLY